MANTKQNLPSSKYPNQVTSYVSQRTEAVAGGFLTLKSTSYGAGSIPPALKLK